MGIQIAGVAEALVSNKISVLSAEPVGVWRTYQTVEDYRACDPVGATAPPLAVSPARPGEPLLSACLIVRDEEPRLASCLESIQDVVDEIVIVDTGSTDRTKEIARRFTSRVFDFPWQASFAAARNEARRHARGQWILSLDADETARPFSRRVLHELLSDDTRAGYYVLFRRRANLTPNWQMKLYRNHPALAHESVIHEAIRPGQVRAATGRRLGQCELQFEHSGYEGNLDHKHARNLPLLEKALSDAPDRPNKAFIWCHLADIQDAMGEHWQADRSRQRALSTLPRQGELHPVHSAVYLAALTRHAHRGEDIAPLLAEASRLFPGNLQLKWIEGHWRMNRGEYERAIPCFEELIEKGQSRSYSHWAGYDQRIFGALSYRSISRCVEASSSARDRK